LSEVEQLDVVQFGDRDTVAERDVSFEEFVDGASGRLFATALLMTSRNRAEAEDLLQAVLERAYRRWRRICRGGDPEPYVRKMLVNASVDQWRRLHRRAEQPLETACEAATSDGATEIADRDLLLRALAELPPGQRAVLVLRYFSDLSEAETAATLGCSVGSVKSQAARGIARLREITEPAEAGTRRGGVTS
jgi:RNA polymerase sigma-70 factor (sigma-E family)